MNAGGNIVKIAFMIEQEELHKELLCSCTCHGRFMFDAPHNTNEQSCYQLLV